MKINRASGAVLCQTLGVAVSQGPDPLGAWLGKGVVGYGCAVCSDTQDLAQLTLQGLRLVTQVEGITGADQQGFVLQEQQAPSIVLLGGLGGACNQNVAAGNQAVVSKLCAKHGGSIFSRCALGIGEIYQAVLLEARVQCDIEVATLAASQRVGSAGDFPPFPTLQGYSQQLALTLRNQQVAIGKLYH